MVEDSYVKKRLFQNIIREKREDNNADGAT